MANIGVTFNLQINNDFVSDIKRNIQVSSAKAAFVVASSLKSRGRADIRASTKGLANAFRVDVYEDKKKGGFPKIFARVRTGYSKVFEEGAVINGKPFLWLPMPAARKLMGVKRVQPKDWSRRYGKLSLVKGKGKPLLVGQYGLNQKAVASGKRRRLVGLKKAGAGYQAQATPLFVGIRTSTITARWHLRAIAASEFAKLPALIKRL